MYYVFSLSDKAVSKWWNKRILLSYFHTETIPTPDMYFYWILDIFIWNDLHCKIWWYVHFVLRIQIILVFNYDMPRDMIPLISFWYITTKYFHTKYVYITCRILCVEYRSYFLKLCSSDINNWSCKLSKFADHNLWYSRSLRCSNDCCWGQVSAPETWWYG